MKPGDAQAAMLKAAFTDSPDGFPFGVEIGVQTRDGARYFLLTRPTYTVPGKRGVDRQLSTVSLSEVTIVKGKPKNRPVIGMGHAAEALLEAAAEDFGDRLQAKGMDRGKMPAPGGCVRMHPQFGRELAVLMMAANSHQVVPEACRLWREATPDWRKRIFERAMHIDREGETIYPYDREHEHLLEDLRQQAPDGSTDLARKNAIMAPRQAAMNQLKAIRIAQAERRRDERKAA